MTPAQRALLRDCATALDRIVAGFSSTAARGLLAYIAALQQRIKKALAKKGKRNV